MTILYLVIGIIIGGVGVYFYLNQRKPSGSTQVAPAADPKADKIMDLFNSKPAITNDDVQAALGVSDATATRYLDELEKQGKIRQQGTTGKGVTYTRISN